MEFCSFVNSPAIRKKYQISSHHDTILLFNENISSPIASLSMPEIPTTTLHHVISANQYLALPRLSSQVSNYRIRKFECVLQVSMCFKGIFESLCPVERKKPMRKRLCVVLVTKRSTDFDAHRESFRQYAQLSQYKNQEQRVRLTYIYHDRQSEFVNSLIPSEHDEVCGSPENGKAFKL